MAAQSFSDLTERTSADLQSSDELAVQPDSDVIPQRSSLQSLTTYFENNFSYGRERILRDYEDQTGTTSTGVTSFVLPTDYADYEHLEIVTMSAGNVADPVRLSTAWMDLQTATGDNLPKIGVLDNAESGSRQWLTWTRSTRTLASAGQGTVDVRIVSLKLYTIGDPADTGSSGGDTSSVNGVPDTPGTFASIGQVLSVTGTDPTDYDWENLVVARENLESSLASEIETNRISIAGLNASLDVLVDLIRLEVSTASGYNATLNAQLGQVRPLILVFSAAISGIRSGERYDYSAGQVSYVAPTSDDVINLFVLPQGGAIADNSITPAKAQADTAARQKAWRERFGSAHIGAGTTLPATSASNDGDVRIFTQDVASGLSWRDISDTTTTITSASGGDVALYLGTRLGWTRVGNIFRSTTSGLNQAQVDARVTAGIATLESQVWPGEAVVSPHELYSDYGAFTMRATINRVGGTFPNGARMRIVAGGRTGAFVHAVDDLNSPAVLSFTEAQSRALIQNSSNGFIGGSPFLDVYESDETTRIARLPLRIAVIPSGKWRTITTPSSPYTVQATDDEFMIEVTQTQTGARNVPVIKEQLTPGTSKEFTFAQSRVDNNSNTQSSQLNVTLSANQMQLALSFSGHGSASWSVTKVFAR